MNFEKELSELYPWMLRMARRYHWALQDAEDLVGETVCKMLLNRDKFDCDKPMKPWCLAVMQNTYITLYNRNSLIQFTSYDIVTERWSTHNASNAVMFKDVLSAISYCMRNSCCMECVIYCAKGYSYDEISQLLNIPVGTVRSRISNGRKMLSQMLDK